MKRSIPLRASVGAIDTTRHLGLTEGQRKALAQIQAWEKQEAQERELRLVASTLGPKDSKAAGEILMALAASEGLNSPVGRFLLIAAGNLIEGYDPVHAFKEGLDAYQSRSACSDCSPDAPKGGQK